MRGVVARPQHVAAFARQPRSLVQVRCPLSTRRSSAPASSSRSLLPDRQSRACFSSKLGPIDASPAAGSASNSPAETLTVRTYSPLNPGNPIGTGQGPKTSGVSHSTTTQHHSSTEPNPLEDPSEESAGTIYTPEGYPVNDARAVPSIKAYNPIAYDISSELFIVDEVAAPAEPADTPNRLTTATPRVSSNANTALMADDASYEAFLNKAQSDRQAGASVQAASKPKSEDIGAASAPAELHALSSRTFTSEADEAFEPVSLPLKGDQHHGGKLSTDAFAQTIGVDADAVSSITVKDFDPRNEYADVVSAVATAAGSSSVHVFEVAGRGSRKWYWIVAVAGDKLVGVRVLSVEG